jgi:hypothetical protein
MLPRRRLGSLCRGRSFQVAGWPVEKAETRQGVLFNIERRDSAWNGHHAYPPRSYQGIILERCDQWCCGCSGHERYDDHHCPTEDHEEIYYRWVVALAWLGIDCGNDSVGNWDGCGLALVTIGALGYSLSKPRRLPDTSRGATDP